MDENNIVAAILTVACNSADVRDAVGREAVLQTYDKLRQLLRERTEQGSLESLPEKVRSDLEQVGQKHAARTKTA